MSEWIPIEQQKPPKDHSYIATIKWGTILGVKVIRVGDTPSDHIIAWMPLPEAYIKPKVLFEVPKDGKAYLCMHEMYGVCFIYWHLTQKEYSCVSIGTSRDVSDKCYDGVSRYMDEKGIWHERET